MVTRTIPFRGWRDDEEPVDELELLTNALLAFGFSKWSELAAHLEIADVYQYTQTKNPRSFNRKYIIKLAHRLMEKMNDMRFDYEKRIEAMEAELRGDNGLCSHCPIRMRHND